MMHLADGEKETYPIYFVVVVVNFLMMMMMMITVFMYINILCYN